MTIGKRIISGFGILVALVATVGGFSLVKFSSTEASSKAIENATPSLLSAQAMLTRTLENYALVQEHILTTDEKEIAGIETKMKANSAANGELAKKYEASIDNDEERALFGHVDAVVARRQQPGKLRKALVREMVNVERAARRGRRVTDALGEFRFMRSQIATRRVLAAGKAATHHLRRHPRRRVSKGLLLTDAQSA